MINSARRAILLVASSCILLAGCDADVSEGRSDAAGAQLGEARDSPQSLESQKLYRCFFLATDGRLVGAPQSITSSKSYTECVEREDRAPMSAHDFRVAIGRLYPMAKLESSPDHFCVARGGDEVCIPKLSADGRVHASYSPTGTLKSLGITWQGHSMGGDLLNEWGEPVSTNDSSSGLSRFYQTQDYPYVILSVGRAETSVTITFEL